jgi:hypothetical protein
MIEAGDKHHPPLDDPHCTKSSRRREPPRETSKSRSETQSQVPLDAVTQAMQLDSLPTHKDDESIMEISGRALA